MSLFRSVTFAPLTGKRPEETLFCRTNGREIKEKKKKTSKTPPAAEEESRLQLVDDVDEDDPETIKELLKEPKPIIEALLFSSSEPLPAVRIKQILRGAGIKSLPKLIDEINENYESQGRVYRIEEIAGGYRMMTLPQYAPWMRKLRKQKQDTKLSQAALETLSVVAYRQPLTRAEVDAIRGVSSSSLIKGLIEKGLLRIVGQAEVIGRPLLYGTTSKFLDVFGLGHLKELPDLESTAIS